MSPPFANLAVFVFLSWRKRSILLSLKPLQLFFIIVNPLRNVNNLWAVENLLSRFFSSLAVEVAKKSIFGISF